MAKPVTQAEVDATVRIAALQVELTTLRYRLARTLARLEVPTLPTSTDALRFSTSIRTTFLELLAEKGAPTKPAPSEATHLGKLMQDLHNLRAWARNAHNIPPKDVTAGLSWLVERLTRSLETCEAMQEDHRATADAIGRASEELEHLAAIQVEVRVLPAEDTVEAQEVRFLRRFIRDALFSGPDGARLAEVDDSLLTSANLEALVPTLQRVLTGAGAQEQLVADLASVAGGGR